MADESLIRREEPSASLPEDPSRPVEILYIDAEGAGFANSIEIPGNMTVASLFRAKKPGKEAGNYVIRVNNDPVRGSRVLVHGDKVSVTPTKIAGA